MREVLLDDINFEINFEALFKKARINPESEKGRRLSDLANTAAKIARPKALYGIAIVQKLGRNKATFGGLEFKSRILRVNLESADIVFPFVATCGKELDEWSKGQDGILEGYWVEILKEMALDRSRNLLRCHIRDNQYNGPISRMNPGSLEDWPLSEQVKLFSLLNPEDKIGVRLSGSNLMKPVKSTSGIWFPSEMGFSNCQLCPDSKCPKRRAPYDPGLYERRYGY